MTLTREHIEEFEKHRKWLKFASKCPFYDSCEIEPIKCSLYEKRKVGVEKNKGDEKNGG